MDLNHLFSLAATFLFPVVGSVALLATKLSSGETRRFAQRQFIASLIVVTMVTLHTVATANDAWFVHTLTLATMTVGALALPNHDTSMAI